MSKVIFEGLVRLGRMLPTPPITADSSRSIQKKSVGDLFQGTSLVHRNDSEPLFPLGQGGRNDFCQDPRRWGLFQEGFHGIIGGYLMILISPFLADRELVRYGP